MTLPIITLGGATWGAEEASLLHRIRGLRTVIRILSPESFAKVESFICRHIVKATNVNAGQGPSHVPVGGIESTAEESVLGCAPARSPSSPPCSASAGRDPLTGCRATAGTVGIGRALARWARAPLHVVKVALRALTTSRNADDAWLKSPCHQPVAIGPGRGTASSGPSMNSRAGHFTSRSFTVTDEQVTPRVVPSPPTCSIRTSLRPQLSRRRRVTPR